MPEIEVSFINTSLLLLILPADAIFIPSLPLFVNSMLPFETMFPLKTIPLVEMLFTDVTPVP